MKNITSLVVFLVSVQSVAASPSAPTWLRQPAVSPDGKHIAFTHAGQLWRVPAEGGEAVPLTSALFRAGNPV